MKRNLKYLAYLIKHKWYVYVAGTVLKVPYWRLLIHDWTKFLPSEWIPYAHTFYTFSGLPQYDEHPKFSGAWNHHQKANKHHWQYWVLMKDQGGYETLEIPEVYVREMVADWAGAGRAITGKWQVHTWYELNKKKMKIHPKTKKLINELLILIQ